MDTLKYADQILIGYFRDKSLARYRQDPIPLRRNTTRKQLKALYRTPASKDRLMDYQDGFTRKSKLPVDMFDIYVNEGWGGRKKPTSWKKWRKTQYYR